MDVAHIARRIAADFESAALRITTLSAPAGYQWRESPGALSWFAGDVLASTRFGASIFLSRVPFDADDPDQVHIEVRLFWNHSPGEAQRVGAHRAILWCERGRRFAGQNRSLLGRPALFLRAATIEALCDALESPIREAVAVHTPTMAAATA